MLIPKKLKHRKHHRGHTYGKSTAGDKISFGSFALKALESGWVTARQIEAARRAITHSVQRGGKIWIRVFADKPVTVHGNESPMGGGKGAVDHFVSVIKRGRIMFEMDGISEVQAKEAMRLASHKLPLKSKFLVKGKRD
ncbi:MAG: 50S ribosomal protein L16 [Candidatus Doudnabacteria bacterium CG10_big_fil_rev_8_21_14_0_10_42_18]|uniref:Large ribosomal subunit protein uL16 n=1 Tax=Candidatus Doudnabacteria bacterium CG10_big_fil_rev_8_21_14_0_10_42_18 TaxID=1974552 RepID=A0A2H0VBI2_9BACT|nr:MAG: 50S ribosomal protein L16 [Candidatus Doudnabacteria bacterium CG10_big_fil_rev_8_21_14_0_10_42_18]